MATPAITVRAAEPEDGPGMGLVHIAAWQVGYRGILPDAHLDRLNPEDRGQRWTEFLERKRDGLPTEFDGPVPMLAVADGRVAGMASYGPYRPTPVDNPGDHDELCELWSLNVHPDHWGTGVAQILMTRILDDLRADQPRTTAALWVLEGNARGRRFYQKVGWRYDGCSKTEQFAGQTINELRYTTGLRP